MLLDTMLQFSNNQAVTASAASTYGIDIGIGRNLGAGEPLFLVTVLTADMTDVGSDTTITPTLRTSATATGSGSGLNGSIALTGSITTLLTQTTFPALSKAGTKVINYLPPSDSYEQYLDVYYTAANGNLTTGNFTSFICKDTDLQHFYPAGYTIS